MSAGTVPIQMCDHENGCTEWMVDHYETGATNWRDLLGGWAFDPYKPRDAFLAFCPKHATEAQS